MLFNSYAFILGFLPVVMLGFYLAGRHSHVLAAVWLVAASLFFYGWWDARYVGLLLASIAFNFGAGSLISRSIRVSVWQSRILLAAAIAVNLGLLVYFKYANFFVDSFNQLTGGSHILATVVLPLGISFFTFTQIAFLVDTYQGKAKETNFVHYALFVTYFPHLIAGPVLHHAEMMPQFSRRNVCRINWDNVAVGLSIFVLGLAKKVLLADSAAEYSTPVFEGVRAGGQPMLFEAWIGALAYTLQLYFDFSAYSDMAIGLSLMFNIRLPLNFDSPYKATSIIDFWRRWHMTLSRFLRDYLYIPLGGGRMGAARRYVNLMVTMVLGGLWHGAGWTFVIWGTLHGFYILVNHAWRAVRLGLGWGPGGLLTRLGGGVLTSQAVVVAWVFFRADSLSSAVTILQGMAGMHGVSLPVALHGKLGAVFGGQPWLVFEGLGPFSAAKALGFLSLGYAIVWLMPNVQQIFQRYLPVCEEGQKADARAASPARPTVPMGLGRVHDLLQWKPSRLRAWTTGLLFAVTLMSLTRVSEFLYFQF